MATGRLSYVLAFTMELGRRYLCTPPVCPDARCASDLDGFTETVMCDRDPVKTAMEREQVRENARDRLSIARVASGDSKMSSYTTLQYPLHVTVCIQYVVYVCSIHMARLR